MRRKELTKQEKNFLDSLEWYVLNYNFNGKSVERFNIFRHSRFSEYTLEELKNFISFEDFKERIKSNLSYCYWSKREYEIFVGDAFETDLSKYEKIDVYSQVLPNLDILARYIIDKWNNRPYSRKGKELENGETND